MPNVTIFRVWATGLMLALLALAALVSVASVLGCLIGVAWWMAEATRAFLAGG